MSKLPLFIAITAAVIALGFFVYVTDAPAHGGSAPETCANCHVMDSQYENWYHAPHEKFTECVDCHLPHENVVAYYLEKGRQGAKDVYAFTTGNIPVAIRASEKTKRIREPNHGSITNPYRSSKNTNPVLCTIPTSTAKYRVY